MMKTLVLVVALASLTSVARADADHPNSVQVAENDLDLVHTAFPGGPDRSAPKRGKEFAAAAAACHAYAATMVDLDGQTIPVHVGLGNTKVTPMSARDAIARVCDPLAEVARDWNAKIDHANDAAAAPYRKAGLGGTKLSFVAEHAGYLFSIGGREINTPADAVKASTFFILLQPSGSNGWLLQRYVFHGNALASSSQASYLHKPSPAVYR